MVIGRRYRDGVDFVADLREHFAVIAEERHTVQVGAGQRGILFQLGRLRIGRVDEQLIDIAHRHNVDGGIFHQLRHREPAAIADADTGHIQPRVGRRARLSDAEARQ